MALGKFITFEGGEGAGKSTQCELLADTLTESGIDVVVTREPGGTPAAEQIRQLLVTGDLDLSAKTELLLHMAARSSHVQDVIEPALLSGQWVICDRFMHSTFAYQGFGHGLGLDYVSSLHRLVFGRLQPCLTFILDISAENGLARAAVRGGSETRYEQMDLAFHTRLREGFLTLAAHSPERMEIVDATQSIDFVQAAVRERTARQFGL